MAVRRAGVWVAGGRIVLALSAVFGADVLTKLWAERMLAPSDPATVIGDLFQFTLGHNTGVAFGLFADRGPWPLVVTGVIILGLIMWTLVSAPTRSARFADVPFGLILGGALGNFLDRLHDGRVTNFLDFGLGAARWPTFNLADSSIVLGVTLLMLLSLRASRPGHVERPVGQVDGSSLPWKGGLDGAGTPNP